MSALVIATYFSQKVGVTTTVPDEVPDYLPLMLVIMSESTMATLSTTTNQGLTIFTSQVFMTVKLAIK